jgi:WD40 repeat protein
MRAVCRFGFLGPIAAIVVGIGVSPAIAQQAPPPGGLFLDVDPGGHRGPVWTTAFTPDGRYLLSGGDDKAVRVWDVATGKTAHFLRGDIGKGDNGKVFSLAVSRDNRTAAIAGRFGAKKPYGAIRLFDIESKEQRGIFVGAQGIVLSMAFSKSGRLLASADALGNKGSVTVWNVADGKIVQTFAYEGSYPVRVRFLDETHVVSAGDDGNLKVFPLGEGGRVKTIPCGQPLTSLSISQDGSLVAAGQKDGTVRLWSWPSLEQVMLFRPNIEVTDLAFGSGPSANLLAVASGASPFEITIWDVRTWDRTGIYTAHDNIVKTIAFSPDGRMIASGGGNRNQIDVWPATAAAPAAEKLLAGGGRSVWSVGFLRAPDGTDVSGTYISWGFTDPCPGDDSCPEQLGELEFAFRLPDVRSPRLGDPKALIEGKGVASGSSVLPLVAWRAVLKSSEGELLRDVDPADDRRFPTLSVRRGETKLAISNRNTASGNDQLSYSFSPDGAWVVSGGRNGVLDIIPSRQGDAKPLGGHDGDVPAVAVSEDGKLVVSGSNDQTVRLWNSATGELIVSLLHLPPSDPREGVGDWIMWTPQGYFAASPNGEKLVGWHVNKGPGMAADFVTAEQTRTYFYRSDVIERAIILGSAEAALSEFATAGRLQPVRIADIARRKPKITRFEPANQSRVKLGRVEVVLGRVSQPDPIVNYTIFVNGTQVASAGPDSPQVNGTGSIKFDVPLYGGRNEILIRAVNSAKVPTEDKFIVFQEGTGPLDNRHNAYILAIGVDKYERMPMKNLLFAGSDALSFTSAMQAALTTTHSGKINTLVYTTATTEAGTQPTRAHILDALKFLLSAQEDDTAVLFIAGHGTNAAEDIGYAFLPSDADLDDFSNLVPWSEVQAVLDQVKGLTLMFVDTCRSAHVFDLKSRGDAQRSRAVFFSSSTSQQDAIEDAAFNGGLFTNAIVEGFKNLRADSEVMGNRDRAVQFRELGSFVTWLVEANSKGEQVPDLYYDNSLPKFSLMRKIN